MRIPSATYRVQFNANFRFLDAEALIPYLHGLGISHLYSSPHYRARKGSLHGYDVADPVHLNPELGSEADFRRLSQQLRRYQMGLLLDIVPNHMAVSCENPWWMDVLEHGRKSPYASYFDINWDSPGSKFPSLQKDRIVIPFLTDFYERVLNDQRIVLRSDQNGFFVEVEGNRFPVNPQSYPMIFDICIQSMEPSEGLAKQAIQEVVALRNAFSEPHERADILSLKKDLWELQEAFEDVRKGIEEGLTVFNGTRQNVASFEKLDSLLSVQAYRLAFWRTAGEEVNYRRFFGLNDLISLRIEDPGVFANRHARTIEMVVQDVVDGLRVDHIDGLRNPLEYLQRLQGIASSTTVGDPKALGIYTIVEKIMSGNESLPSEWPTAGTTGYDYLNAVNTLFIDGAGSRELEAIYRKFTGIRSSFTETWSVRKRQVMEDLFAADIRMLSSLLGRLAVLDRLGRDIPMRELGRGLKEITASLPIYRTYCRSLQLSDTDRLYLERAFKYARERAPLSAVSIPTFDFLRRIFLLDSTPHLGGYENEWLDFLLRWQQFTGAVMAKGLEDTAFFVHHGLISLNEVGCNPLRKEIRFGVAAFHDYNQKAFRDHPFTLNATSTHDTKWSEDVRARINVLSELPVEWGERLTRWANLNQLKKTMVEGRPVPSPNEEVLLYQSMLGVWPFGENLSNQDRDHLRERIEAFILKAAREAKTHSSWVSPHESHEAALKSFVSAILDGSSENPFLADFQSFLEHIGADGACNAYSQVLLKIASPGVPDFYQGNEVWNLQLTDPDNRSSVDFESRAKLLAEMGLLQTEMSLSGVIDLLKSWKDGRLKLYLTKQALNFRRSHLDIFLKGDYLPLEVSGAQRNSVFSFARRWGRKWTIVAVPRLITRLTKDGAFPLGQSAWRASELILPDEATGEWMNIFTGETLLSRGSRRTRRLALSDVFSHLPFALLCHIPSQA